MPALEGVKCRDKPASHLLRARFFAGIIDVADVFIICATLLFRRDHRNRTIVLYAFPAVSSQKWLGAELKFVRCRHAFIGSGASLNNATVRERHLFEQEQTEVTEYRKNSLFPPPARDLSELPPVRTLPVQSWFRSVVASELGGEGCFGTT